MQYFCFTKYVNATGMRKIAVTLLLAAGLLSACSPYGMQGSPAAVTAGAAIGGVLGSIIGDRAGGYGGSQFGALVGTVAGAAIGNAATTPRQDTYGDDGYYVDSRSSAPRYNNNSRYEEYPVSNLQITNLRFIDDNRNHVIDAEEESKLIFDIVNNGEVAAYNITPVVEELNGIKHLQISSPSLVSYLPAGESIRYTAVILGEKKLKTDEAAFRVYAAESNGAVTEMHEFSLPTQARMK